MIRRYTPAVSNVNGQADFDAGNYSPQTLRVVIANNQPAIPAVSSTRQDFRSFLVDRTADAISASPGNILGWNIINRHSAAIYVKFYDEAAASVDPSNDSPVLTLQVPALGSVFQEPNGIQKIFATAISVRVVTGVTDTDNTDPGTLPLIEIQYTN